MKMRNKTLLTVAVFAIAASFICGQLVIHPWNFSTRTAFCFIMLAEVIFFSGLYVIDYGPKTVLSQAGIISTLSVYIIVSIGISVYFILHFPFNVLRLWALQIAVLAAAIIIVVLLLAASKYTFESDSKKMQTVSQLQEYVNRLSLISLNEKDINRSKAINKLADNLRYTDISKKVDLDDEIGDRISSIEMLYAKDKVDEDTIDNECQQLDSLIKRRKIAVSSSQRGQY